MTEVIDELGPVDFLVVEFPGSDFNGEILPELADLVQRGIVRVLDLVVIKKDADGSYEAFEFGDRTPARSGKFASWNGSWRICSVRTTLWPWPRRSNPTLPLGCWCRTSGRHPCRR